MEGTEAIDIVVVTASAYGLQVLGGIILLIVGWMVASWAGRITNRSLEKSDRVDATLRLLAAKMVRLLVMAFVLIAVLNNFGVQTASIIAVLGAAGLAIGLALQGTLSNVASGVLLLTVRPFEVGDFVEVAGELSTVREIGLLTTECQTPDGIFLLVPNTQVWSGKIRNFGRHEQRRFTVDIGISYGDDINKAIETALAVLRADERVLQDPEPLVAVSDLGDSSVDLMVRAWTSTPDWWPTQLAVRKALKESFDDAGLSIPFPQRDVHLIKE